MKKKVKYYAGTIKSYIFMEIHEASHNIAQVHTGIGFSYSPWWTAAFKDPPTLHVFQNCITIWQELMRYNQSTKRNCPYCNSNSKEINILFKNFKN